MPRRSSKPSIAVLACLLVLTLVGGIWLGGHPNTLPRTVRDALVGDDEARTLDTALDLIQRDYYRPVPRGRLFGRSLSGLVDSLNDDFSAYFDPRTYRQFKESSAGSFSGVGLNVAENRRGLRVLKVYRRSPAAMAGLAAGDLIVAVDGRRIAGKSSSFATALIKGPAGTPVRLAIVTRGERRVERLIRSKISIPSVESRLRSAAGRRFAHIELSSFTSGVHGTLRGAIERRRRQGARGIVLDLRGNGGGLLSEAVLVSSTFISEGTIVTTRARSRGRRTYRASGSSIPAGIPVVVLVDRGSASASEIVAGALQDRGRARVVGTRTFGKGVFQAIEELPNGGALELTVGEYFTPKGRSLGGGGVRRGAGVRPDVPARDRAGTRRDEALDIALRELSASRP